MGDETAEIVEKLVDHLLELEIGLVAGGCFLVTMMLDTMSYHLIKFQYKVSIELYQMN